MFNIDIETCQARGGPAKVIACIEDAVVIKKILDHLKEKSEYQDTGRLPESCGPPQAREKGEEKEARKRGRNCFSENKYVPFSRFSRYFSVTLVEILVMSDGTHVG